MQSCACILRCKLYAVALLEGYFTKYIYLLLIKATIRRVGLRGRDRGLIRSGAKFQFLLHLQCMHTSSLSPVHNENFFFLVQIESKLPSGSSDEWKFVRICHLDSRGNAVKIGLYCCSPTKEGMSVVFDQLSIQHSDGSYHHKAS